MNSQRWAGLYRTLNAVTPHDIPRNRNTTQCIYFDLHIPLQRGKRKRNKTENKNKEKKTKQNQNQDTITIL